MMTDSAAVPGSFQRSLTTVIKYERYLIHMQKTVLVDAL